jgi:rhodanese-related sulfurtransferase/DNA-binding HxlR family transcriptional regulator
LTAQRRKEALHDTFAQVAKAMGNAKRLLLIDVLSQCERTVDSLARATGLGITTTSAHLQALRHSGLVASRREGTRIYYSLSGEDVAQLYVVLREVARAHHAEAELAVRDYLGQDDVEHIAREDLLQRLRAERVIVLDVRPAEEFASGHIDSAVSIPLDELRHRLAEFPDDCEVIVYCRGADCVLAYEAVRLLQESGISANRLEDGMLEWRLAGLPVTTGAA